MMIARRRSGSTGLRHGLARLLTLLVLVLMAAGGLQPAMGCATGADARASAMHHGEGSARSDHGRHTQISVSDSESAPNVPADATGATTDTVSSAHRHAADGAHNPAGSSHAGSCCHLNCPVCLARLPTAPEPLRRTAEPSPLRLHLAPLPAGIVPAPPRAPPRSA